jgi:hypothetical protein
MRTFLMHKKAVSAVKSTFAALAGAGWTGECIVIGAVYLLLMATKACLVSE